MSSFEGKVALVTGGTSGIGQATVELLAARGANVVVADLDGTRAELLAHSLPTLAVGIGTDVTNEADVDQMVAAAVSAFGRLDVAVNNAGTSGTMAPTAELSTDSWRQTLEVNLTGVFFCLRAEIPALRAAGGGAVVNVASSAGLMGFPGLPAYVASKHGVVGLTKAAALEVAREGIRINAVCPAAVRTPMLERFNANDEAALDRLARMQPIGRLGTPAEIAEAIAWLCSDAASYVTGHAFAVDGGVMAT